MALGGPQIGSISIIAHIATNTFFRAAKWIPGKLKKRTTENKKKNSSRKISEKESIV